MFTTWMSRADREQWAAARTLPDLAELTARWLEGDLASQPGYAPNHGPDPETAELVPTLALLNRAGWLTDASQPGEPLSPGYDGAFWDQCAAVNGFTDRALADRITRVACAHRMRVITQPVLSGWFPRGRFWGVEVTRRQGQAYTWFGVQMRRRDVAFHYGYDCHPDAVRAVKESVQLTVVDTIWGRNNVLWPVLREAVSP